MIFKLFDSEESSRAVIDDVNTWIVNHPTITIKKFQFYVHKEYSIDPDGMPSTIYNLIIFY